MVDVRHFRDKAMLQQRYIIGAEGIGRYDIRTLHEKPCGERGYAVTVGGVLSVTDNHINPLYPFNPREIIPQELTSDFTDNIADTQYSHMYPLSRLVY
jgi:hypothetical protein